MFNRQKFIYVLETFKLEIFKLSMRQRRCQMKRLGKTPHRAGHWEHKKPSIVDKIQNI